MVRSRMKGSVLLTVADLEALRTCRAEAKSPDQDHRMFGLPTCAPLSAVAGS